METKSKRFKTVCENIQEILHECMENNQSYVITHNEAPAVRIISEKEFDKMNRIYKRSLLEGINGKIDIKTMRKDIENGDYLTYGDMLVKLL